MDKPKTLKLFDLKDFFTLPEAAVRLSESLGQQVSKNDILSLYLHRRLKLSIYFTNPVILVPGEVVSYQDAEWIKIPDEEIEEGGNYDTNEFGEPAFLKGDQIDSERVFDSNSASINKVGIFDLLGGDGDRLCVEMEYQKDSHDIDVSPSVNVDGIFVKDEDGVTYRIHISLDDVHYNNEALSGSMAKFKLKINDVAKELAIDRNEAEKLVERSSEWKEERRSFLDKFINEHTAAYCFPDDSYLVIRRKNLIDFEKNILINGNEDKNKITISSHQSDDLRLLLEASDKFWKNADPDCRDTHPTNDEVEAWLMNEHDWSQRLAGAAASIIRPDFAGVGRKSK